MPLTAQSMASKIKSYTDSVSKINNIASGEARRQAILVAMCQGIIDEIQQNGIVQTSDAQGGTNTGVVL